jgi:hypothetical protein
LGADARTEVIVEPPAVQAKYTKRSQRQRKQRNPKITDGAVQQTDRFIVNLIGEVDLTGFGCESSKQDVKILLRRIKGWAKKPLRQEETHFHV